MSEMKAFDNFEKALSQLEQFLSYKVEDNRDRAGVIQAFEFTFEQAWKAIQKHCSSEGVEVRSPRQAFEELLSLGLVPWESEEELRSIIDDRNLTSHTYKETTAEEVFKRIQLNHLPLLKSILRALQPKGES